MKPSRDAGHARLRTPQGTRCPQCLSPFGEPLARGKIACTSDTTGKTHEALTAVIALASEFELLSDEPALGHARTMRRFPQPLVKIVGYTYCDCVTHMAIMYYNGWEVKRWFRTGRATCDGVRRTPRYWRRMVQAARGLSWFCAFDQREVHYLAIALSWPELPGFLV